MKRLIYGRVPDAILLFILAMTVRLVHIDHTPFYDEFYHVLAAQSWLHDGSMHIAEGEPYTRGDLYTLLVAGFFKVFGQSLVVARIPAVIAGSLWVVILYLWTWRVAGRMAGWVAALLLCFAPGAISISEMSRFYSLHGLCFFLGATGIYTLLQERPPWPKNLAVGAVSVLALGLAWRLQVTTAVGLAGVALWAAFKIGTTWRLALRTRQLQWISAFTSILFLCVLVVAIHNGLASKLLENSRWTALWNAQNSNNLRFYHYWFLDQYPTLWTLLPLPALLGLARRPAPAFFSLCVFGTSLILHSLAAAKESRYLFHSIPFLFALWGIAIALVLPAIYGQIAIVMENVRRIQPNHVLGNSIKHAWVVGILIFIVAANPAFPLAYRMLSLSDADWPFVPGYRGHPDWAAAVAVLKPLADNADVVLSSVSVKSLYFLGRCDAEIRADNLFSVTGFAPEFSKDPRTGHPVISTHQSLSLMMARYPTGLVIVESPDWGMPAAVPPATADYLAAHAEIVPLPKEWRLMAYRWDRAGEVQPIHTSDPPSPLSLRHYSE
jgi:hypothetical protein